MNISHRDSNLVFLGHENDGLCEFEENTRNMGWEMTEVEESGVFDMSHPRFAKVDVGNFDQVPPSGLWVDDARAVTRVSRRRTSV